MLRRGLMRLKFITATALLSACLLPLLFVAAPLAAEEIQLQENRPQSYTVQKGDTLWGIAGKFLKQPWRWPALWRMNRDQIKNPHWIYPGDVVAFDRSDGKPRLTLERGARGSDATRLTPAICAGPLAANDIP